MPLLLIFLCIISFNLYSAEKDSKTVETTDSASQAEISEQQKIELKQKSIKQLNLLFNKTYNKAETELITTGTFTPFGAIVGATGKVNFIRIDTEMGTDAEKMVRAIQSTMIDLAKKKEIFASAVYYMTENLETAEGIYPKALIGRLEHATGVSLAIATRVTFGDQTVQFTPPVTTEIPSEVFYWAYQTKVGKNQ